MFIYANLTPPAENSHCKISSLTLRHFALIAFVSANEIIVIM